MLQSPMIRPLHRLASLKVTLVGVLALVLAAFLAAAEQPSGNWLLSVASGLLALNLLAALVAGPVFRRNAPLFAFHLGLLTVFLCIAMGSSTRLRAHFEIAEGQHFDADQLVVDSRGWLQSGGLPAGAFRQGEIEVDYAEGIERAGTRSWVLLSARGDDAGRAFTLADGRPLVVDGYRFYPTHNKGFSALVTWWPQAQGERVTGTVNFPSFPRLSWDQVRTWSSPAGTEYRLELKPTPFPADRGWTLSKALAGEALYLTGPDGATATLRPGQAIAVDGGLLQLERFGMWMGYRVFYEPTLAWLFASTLLTLLALAWWLWEKLGFSPSFSLAPGVPQSEQLVP